MSLVLKKNNTYLKNTNKAIKSLVRFFLLFYLEPFFYFYC